MFDSYAKNSLHINAVTGAIIKNHAKSWFERFHLKSNRAEALLREGGHVGGYNRTHGENYPDIIVLQMVICGDMEVIAECIYKRDFCTEAGEGKQDER